MGLIKLLYEYLKTKYRRVFSSKERLEAYQKKKIAKFKKRVLAKSKFYSTYLERDICDFPLMNKKKMLEHFDAINTTKIRLVDAMAIAMQGERGENFIQRQGMTIGLSSGTSGNKGLFLASDEERYKWAGIMLAKALPSSLFSTHKIAFFLRVNSSLYTSLGKSRLVRFEFFPLSKGINSHVERLNQVQPTILAAPPSMLRILAKEKIQGNLYINPIKIFSIAEVLEPLDKKLIEEAFQQKILHQIYQCTEGFLGITCSYGTLHLNEEYIHFEKKWVDQESRRFSPIITDFTRTTQPIVRYYLNDILVEKESRCPCGNACTAIESIEGRCDDIFYFQSVTHKELVPVFPDYLRSAIIIGSNAVEEYQVLQESTDRMTIHLVGRRLSKSDHSSILSHLDELFIRMKIKPPKIQFFNGIDLNQNEKLRRIKNNATSGT